MNNKGNVNNQFLPVSQDDLKRRNWHDLDIILVTGDGYVDHPSYGMAVISRILEDGGFKVGIIAQPDWRSTADFKKLGRPRLFFGITSGNVDSMIANYTANKRPRKLDDYSPGSNPGLRPDRALIVYSNRIREAFGKGIPIVIGGLEASMRRFAHYDYWDNAVRRSVILDSRADILVYGMGESQIREIAESLRNGKSINSLNSIRGTVFVRKDTSFLKDDFVQLPSFEEVKDNNDAFNKAFSLVYAQTGPQSAKPIAQKYYDRYVIQLPPALPLSTKELDYIYGLKFKRAWHPVYNAQGGIKALETVRFSVISHRGCCGSCSFCSLHIHQGRIIQSRSRESILKEIELISRSPDFKGVVTDIGGPTANLSKTSCSVWQRNDFCNDKQCLSFNRCGNLKLGYGESLSLLRKARQLPGVKHVFIGSGFRFDLLTRKEELAYLKEICMYHISGQMKVAPEHIDANILRLMNKSSLKTYEEFARIFRDINKDIKKEQYLVNYFISSHPGAALKDALNLALYIKRHGITSEQIQDFIPSPMTLSGCMYYTGKHPLTGEEVYVARTFKERKMQRALLQFRNPKNRRLVLDALKKLNSVYLINQLLAVNLRDESEAMRIKAVKGKYTKRKFNRDFKQTLGAKKHKFSKFSLAKARNPKKTKR